jgi:hypothetical protein
MKKANAIILISAIIVLSASLSLAQTDAVKSQILIKETSLFKIKMDCFPTNFVVSPDNKRLAYLARRDDGWFVVIDGSEGKVYELIVQGRLMFSPNSKRMGYSGKQGDKWLTVIDGKEYGGILVRFSPDSKHSFCIKGSGDKAILITDDTESEAKYNKITGVSVSSDGERIAFTAMANNKWVVVVDGVESKGYEGVSGSVFSSDNKHIA